MKALTQKQQEALDYIRVVYAERNVGPTVREIAAHLGIKSSCSSQRHIEALTRKGFVTRDRYKYRSLRPVEQLTVPDAAAEAFERLSVHAADLCDRYDERGTQVDLEGLLAYAFDATFRDADAPFRIVRALRQNGAQSP